MSIRLHFPGLYYSSHRCANMFRLSRGHNRENRCGHSKILRIFTLAYYDFSISTPNLKRQIATFLISTSRMHETIHASIQP